MRFVLRNIFFLLAFPLSALAADVRIEHRLMFFEYGNCPNRFVELDTQGRIVRQFKPRSIAVIFQVLPNGNIVYGYGGHPTGVVEVNAQGETVWNYVSKCPQVLGCERLPNGNTLVAEQGPCRVVEVNPQGETVHVTKLSTNQAGYHLQVRNVHQLKNGNILAAHEGEGAIREYEPDGKTAWEYTGVANTGEALRLENGNTLIAGATQKRLIEVTPAHKIVWEFKADDAARAQPRLGLKHPESSRTATTSSATSFAATKAKARMPLKSPGPRKSCGPSPTTSNSSRSPRSAPLTATDSHRAGGEPRHGAWPPPGACRLFGRCL